MDLVLLYEKVLEKWKKKRKTHMYTQIPYSVITSAHFLYKCQIKNHNVKLDIVLTCWIVGRFDKNTIKMAGVMVTDI